MEIFILIHKNLNIFSIFIFIKYNLIFTLFFHMNSTISNTKPRALKKISSCHFIKKNNENLSFECEFLAKLIENKEKRQIKHSKHLSLISVNKKQRYVMENLHKYILTEVLCENSTSKNCENSKNCIKIQEIQTQNNNITSLLDLQEKNLTTPKKAKKPLKCFTSPKENLDFSLETPEKTSPKQLEPLDLIDFSTDVGISELTFFEKGIYEWLDTQNILHVTVDKREEFNKKVLSLNRMKIQSKEKESPLLNRRKGMTSPVILSLKLDNWDHSKKNNLISTCLLNNREKN